MKKKIKSILFVLLVLILYTPKCFAEGETYSFKEIRALYPELKTERLTLTLETRQDVDILAQYLMDKDVTIYLDDDMEEGFADIQEATDYLLGYGNFYNPRYLTYVIRLKDSSTPIGEIEYIFSSRCKHVNICYWLGKPYWGKKYISEISPIVSNIVMRAADVLELHILYFYANKPSARLSDKIIQYLIEQNKNIEFDEFKVDYPEVDTEGHCLRKKLNESELATKYPDYNSSEDYSDDSDTDSSDSSSDTSSNEYLSTDSKEILDKNSSDDSDTESSESLCDNSDTGPTKN